MFLKLPLHLKVFLISLSLKSWFSYPKKSKSKLGKAIRLKSHRPPTTRRKYIDSTKYKGLRVNPISPNMSEGVRRTSSGTKGGRSGSFQIDSGRVSLSQECSRIVKF